MRMLLAAGALCMIGLTGCVGSTTKITYIHVEQQAEKSGNQIDFGSADIDATTDQSAEGSLESDADVDASAV